jgi:hypothetical protein
MAHNPTLLWGVWSPFQNYQERFANRVRSLRGAAGLSIEKASEEGGLSTNFWGSVERMVQEPASTAFLDLPRG